jgi:2-polyprenyl-3-methyl-5-hydroxy-6-metoxy-1,4-benzoquinol methylase
LLFFKRLVETTEHKSVNYCVNRKIKERRRNGLSLRSIFSFLRIMKMPGLFPIIKDWQALIRIHFLFAAHETGLLQELAHPCGRQALIERLGIKRSDLLDALLDVGLAAKELGLKNQRYFIKGKRSKAIMNSGGDMLAALIQANITYYSDAYRQLANRLYGGELGDDLESIGDLVARFSKIGEPILKSFLFPLVVDKRPMRVLDVGCGSGAFLQSIHNANKIATGFGLDIDAAAVRQAQENLLKWGINDSFAIHQGDVRRLPAEIAGPFDLTLLFNILYYFDDEGRKGLLDKLRAMLSPQGVLAIAMNCHSQGKDMGAANLNIVNCSLKGLTPLPSHEAILSLLKHCGFVNIDIHRIMPGSTFYGFVARNSG